jgi:hypothetical protein
MDHVERFAQVVVQGGVHCTIRRPRGQGNATYNNKKTAIQFKLMD